MDKERKSMAELDPEELARIRRVTLEEETSEDTEGERRPIGRPVSCADAWNRSWTFRRVLYVGL